MPRSAKNKMKAWRRNSPGNGLGRKLKHMSMQQAIGGTGTAAPELLAGVFSRGGIKMPKAESFRTMLNNLLETKALEKAAAEAAAASESDSGTQPSPEPLNVSEAQETDTPAQGI